MCVDMLFLQRELNVRKRRYALVFCACLCARLCLRVRRVTNLASKRKPEKCGSYRGPAGRPYMVVLQEVEVMPRFTVRGKFDVK